MEDYMEDYDEQYFLLMNTIVINNISQRQSQGLSSYWDKIPWEQGWIFQFK